jgi:hypothetical protein
MSTGPWLASRRFQLAVLGLSVSLLSTAAIVAVAQQRPNEFHGVITVGATVSERGAASTVRFAEVSPVDDARIGTSRVVSSTPEKVSVANAPGHHRVSIVTDWSTKHVVFAKPRTEKDAARLERDPRYKMQIYRRNAPAFRKAADARVESANLLDRFRNRVQDPHPTPAKANAAHRDWSVPLGGTGTAEAPLPMPSAGNNQFPAKFTFDINAPPDCQNDFVVYNTNTNLLVAFNNLYSGTDPNTGLGNGICTDGDGTLLTAPTVMWAYNVTEYSDGVTSTSPVLSLDGTQVAVVESSALHGSVLHVIKWVAGQGTIAEPVQLWADFDDWTGDAEDWATNCGPNSLYGVCMWSATFYKDFIGHGGSEPDVKSHSVRPDYYTTRSNATDTNSAPYYDYFNDVIYVGTDTANLHEFGYVFNGGTAFGPTESTFGTYPIIMNTTANPPLTGPIEDAASGRIFVADGYGGLEYVETNSGLVTPGPCSGQPGPTYTYPCLAVGNYNSGGNGIPDPPVVDSSLGTVLVFVGGDSIAGDPDNAFVAQASTMGPCVCGSGQESGGDFSYLSFGPVSNGGTGTHIHSGDFDNEYYESNGTPGSVAGFMYVCAIDPLGTVPGTAGFGNTALRQISFDDNGIIFAVNPVFLAVGTDPTDECSPVTEVYNPNTSQDLMFFSVQVHSTACLGDGAGGVGYSAAAPAGGCLMSVDVTNDVSVPGFFPVGFAAHLAEDGGTSGIIVDNVSTEAQASSVYFTPLGWPDDPGNTCAWVGCAVKATQVGLQ